MLLIAAFSQCIQIKTKTENENFEFEIRNCLAVNCFSFVNYFEMKGVSKF